jgi:hypothetical protein
MHVLVWVLILTVALGSQPAFAQSQWSGSIYGGYATGLDNSDYDHGSIALALGLFNRAERKLGFGLEVGYDHHEDRTDVVPGLGTLEYDRSAWHLTGMLRIRSPRGSIRPYGLAGIGVYGLRQDGDNFFAPGVNLGGGLELHPGDGPVGVSAGARLHLAGRPADDVLQGAGYLALLLGVSDRCLFASAEGPPSVSRPVPVGALGGRAT